MLFLMKSYQQTLEEPDTLASSDALLEQTSALIETNFNIIRQQTTPDQHRQSVFHRLGKRREWISLPCKFKELFDQGDIWRHSIRSYRICLHVSSGNSINPGYMNSDIVENLNLFCQQRSIRNGLTTNPTLSGKQCFHSWQRNSIKYG